jgi:signal peptidase II
MKKLWTLGFVGLASFSLDQGLKWLIIRKLPSAGVFLVSAPNFSLEIKAIINHGLAFSLPVSEFIILMLSVYLIGALILWLSSLVKREAWFEGASAVLVLAGAASNFLDRLIHGGVVDYLAIRIYNFQYAVFNLADVLIVVGLVGLIFQMRKYNFGKK